MGLKVPVEDLKIMVPDGDIHEGEDAVRVRDGCAACQGHECPGDASARVKLDDFSLEGG